LRLHRNGGQSSIRQQAGYMAAPERFADSQIPLAPRAPSIHDPSRKSTTSKEYFVLEVRGETLHRIDDSRDRTIMLAANFHESRMEHVAASWRSRLVRLRYPER
jgi:hypothetical protein